MRGREGLQLRAGRFTYYQIAEELSLNPITVDMDRLRLGLGQYDRIRNL